jgi:hypothetical protein
VLLVAFTSGDRTGSICVNQGKKLHRQTKTGNLLSGLALINQNIKHNVRINIMKAFVYTEIQASVPFAQAPWREINKALKEQDGILNKTWLSGVDDLSVGGFYTFDSVENAQKFVTEYFPSEAKSLGVAQRTLIFDAVAVEEASKEMDSVHFGAKNKQQPGAYVYTEVQLSALPFDNAPWRELNPVLKQQEGILAKTWLSGLHTGTPGGLYAFDTIENAKKFAIDYFPTEAKQLNAAFTTRVFDASVVEEASREMNSPFYK